MFKILKIQILDYGFSVEFIKDNYNPKKINNENDGSITKYRFIKSWYKYSNPYFAVRINYDYTVLLRILMGRE